MQEAASSKRKRSAPFVTQNACVSCRKKRAKCDGKNPCSRCAANAGPNTHCRYEVSGKISKEAMRGEITKLRAYKESSEHVLSALANDVTNSEIIEALKNHENVGQISSLLDEIGFASPSRQSGSSRPSPYTTFMSPANTNLSGGSTSGSVGPQSTASGDISLISPGSGPGNPSGSEMVDITGWTAVEVTAELMNNLLALYFRWEFAYGNVTEPYFLGDLRRGKRRYCTPLLVNSVLAVGSLFLDKAEHPNAEIMGDMFFAEAVRQLDLESRQPSLTKIQALGVMSLHEASRGRDTKSLSYSCQRIRHAVEMGLHNPAPPGTPEPEVAVGQAVFWDAFTLDQFWSLIIGRIPHISRYGVTVKTPSVTDPEEIDSWQAYPDALIPLHDKQLYGHMKIVGNAFASLADIIHESHYVLYEPKEGLSARSLLGIYTQYLNWYDQLPDMMRLGESCTPSIVFVHMYYHFAVIQMFRPFIRLRLPDSVVVPREICLLAANNILEMANSYRRLFTLQRAPSLLPYIIFSAATIHLACLDTNALLVIPQEVLDDMELLNGLAICHKSAHRLCQQVQEMAENWQFVLPSGSWDDDYKTKWTGKQKAADVVALGCNNIKYLPSPSRMRFFQPNLNCELPLRSRDIILRGTEVFLDREAAAKISDKNSTTDGETSLFLPFANHHSPPS